MALSSHDQNAIRFMETKAVMCSLAHRDITVVSGRFGLICSEDGSLVGCYAHSLVDIYQSFVGKYFVLWI